jgi:hypothetical protein
MGIIYYFEHGERKRNSHENIAKATVGTASMYNMHRRMCLKNVHTHKSHHYTARAPVGIDGLGISARNFARRSFYRFL